MFQKTHIVSISRFENEGDWLNLEAINIHEIDVHNEKN